MSRKKIIYSIIALICFFVITNKTNAFSNGFNPNYIISDEEILDSTTMDIADIQSFLKARGSYLANYTTLNANGVYKSAAEIIYDAAVNNYDCDGIDSQETMTEAQKKIKCMPITINPKFLLVLLQKEQSLIEESSPSQTSLDWATGYGCPDGQACNTRWKGFGKQVNSAALQFFDYMKNPQNYIYKVNNTYTLTNTGHPNSVVTPANLATTALYNYTPHVYYGNYNFYNLWARYFSLIYPNNTLLQAKGEPGVWIIKNGVKRPFLSKGALTSRYDINKIISVSKSDLDSYPTGAPLKFAQYSLIRSPRGTVYLLVDDKKRGFTSGEALRKIGYNPEEITDASWDDVNSYEEGLPITATSSYPTGALLQDKKTGGVFWVTEGTKAPLWDKILLKTKFRGKSITPVATEKLASYQTIAPAIFDDGELIKGNNSPGVYVIDRKKRRAFASSEIFEELGYKWKNIITVPQKILDLYAIGEPIQAKYSEENLKEELFNIDSVNGTTTKSSNISTTTASLQEEINSIINP